MREEEGMKGGGNGLFGSEVEREMKKDGNRDYFKMFGRLLE